MSVVDNVVVRTAKCIAETAQAILVETAYGQAWIPRSCISSRSEVFGKGEEGLLVLSKFIADRKAALRQR